MNAKATPAPSWNLDRLYAGGVAGDPFTTEVAAIAAVIAELQTTADAVEDLSDGDTWDGLIAGLTAVRDRISDVSSLAGCAASTHTSSPVARRASSRCAALTAGFARAMARPKLAIAQATDAAFQALIARPALATHRPWLEDLRAESRVLLPPGQQELFAELADTALHAWGRSYRRIAGDLRVDLDGELLSAGQAFNRFEHPDDTVRLRVLEAIIDAWRRHAEPCAEALTHIYATRALRARAGGVDPLDRALADNRIQRSTIDALLSFCDGSRPVIQRYLAAKAKLLGKDELDWSDLRAPVGTAGPGIAWDQARRRILEAFGAFSTDLATFAERAFRDQWIEAEDRQGKRHGAFCTNFPIRAESRVFMTWSGTPSNLITLAHELGHAYHNEVLRGLPYARRRVTKSLAETASTFAEATVRHAELARAQEPAQELALLEQELRAAATMLVNIPLRYRFEWRLFGLRQEGPLTPDRLSAEMETLQRDAYGPLLGRAHPMFWAEKLHFYLTNDDFYNFPYTFGYVFSQSAHATAMAADGPWDDAYVALLQDTGHGPAERTARVHLGLNLADPSCWSPVLERIAAKVARYEALAGTGGHVRP